MKQNQAPSSYIDLRQDLMFKTFFSNQEKLLLSLLNNSLFSKKRESVQALKFKNPQQTKEWLKKVKEKAPLSLKDSALYPDSPEAKRIVLDLLIRLNSGDNVNVEMQAFPHPYFMERAVFYWKSIYGQDLKSGEAYEILKPAHSLIFVNFRVFKGLSKDFRNSFSIRSDKPPHFVLTDHFNMTIVDLSRFLLERKNLKKGIDKMQAWCYFIKNSVHLTDEDFESLIVIDPIFKVAINRLKDLSMDSDLRFAEIQRDKAVRDSYAFFEDGKSVALAQGREEGLQKGRQEGREEGLQEGRQEGREEGLQKGRSEERKQIALKMLKEKADMAFICKITGWTEKEIKKLKNNY